MIWIGLLACMVISFTFSGIEAGVLSVNRVRLRHHALRGEAAAMQLDALLLRLERLMITVVLVNNAANIVGVALLYYHLTEWLGMAGGVVTLIVALPVMVVLLEFLPRVIFRRFPYRTLMVFARILTAAHYVCGPIVAVGAWLLRPLVAKHRQLKDRAIVGKDDIRRITGESVSRGQVSEMGRRVIENVLEFRGLTAAEMMLPFSEASTVRPETGVPEILDRARKTGADRFPVINSDGQCEGVVRVFDLVRDGVSAGRAQSYARRVLSFPPSAEALDVLKKLRAARFSLGLVTDGHGIPVGIVSTEALVSRLLSGRK
jgi:CBS domain containing-hemolysin-like protein